LGIPSGLITNGSYLHGDVAREVLGHAKYVRVSLEAGSREVFARVKGISPRGFDQVVENLEQLLALRRELGSQTEVAIKYTVGTENIGDIESAVRLAQRLGVDSIQFKLYRNVPQELPDWRVASTTLARAASRHPDVRIVANIEPTTTERPCWITPLLMTVDARGDVFLCTYYRHRQPTHRLGNLFQTPLAELRTLDSYRRLVGGIKAEECNRYNCRYHYFNNVRGGPP
jgi:sulfatase maturation enzyme AslB (radical SAM superfamily)